MGGGARNILVMVMTCAQAEHRPREGRAIKALLFSLDSL